MRSLRKYLDIKNKQNLIPINDVEAWIKYPGYNFIYDKLRLAEIQSYNCAPIPIIPIKYPVIIKPIMNLYGMSKGFRKVDSEKEYLSLLKNNNYAGYFWETYLEGLQYNIDIVMKNGSIIKYYGVESYPLENGIFKYHKFLPNYTLNKNIICLLEQLMDDYTGFLNIEIIKYNDIDYIIEGHLRLNGDFFLFEDHVIDNFIDFIETGNFKDDIIKPITFFPIFITDTTKDYNYIGDYLEENKEHICEYKKDDIFSPAQGDYYKRCYYFTCYDFKKGLDIQEKISNNI